MKSQLQVEHKDLFKNDFNLVLKVVVCNIVLFTLRILRIQYLYLHTFIVDLVLVCTLVRVFCIGYC